jgi:hypothetical protein
MSDKYDSNEFDTINYMATSGGLGTADSDARHSYYGISGLPTLVWQGTQYMVGAGTDVIDGAPYDAVVKSRLADATPVKIGFNDWDYSGLPTFVDFDVELTDDMPGTYMVRAFVIEDAINYGGTDYDNVLRDMILEIPLTIDTSGQVQNVYQVFPGDGAWNLANLRIIVIVQDETTKEVMQATNNLPVGDYEFRYYNLGERVVVDAGTHEYGEFALFNTGNLADTYELSFDTSGLPGDWNVWLTDGETVYYGATIALNPGESVSLNVVIETGSSGGGAALMNIHAQSTRTDDRAISYSVITADTDILLVDDDGADSFEVDYYGPALDAYGSSWATWDRGSAAVTSDILSNFGTVVWNCGFTFPTLDDDDRAALGAYLDGGGALFVSGQDIGWDLSDQGGAAYAWYQSYLNVTFVADDTNDYTLDGVAGDPITDGLAITIQLGDGANNQDYPSDVDPMYDGEAIWAYSSTRNGGVRADTGTYRVVYFSFGYEAINSPADRAIVMENVLDWLDPDLTGAEEIPARALALSQNVPNPFNPKTDIRFQLGHAGAVKLEVFDVQGRLIKTLADGSMSAGDHLVTWDGTDRSGLKAPSGLYFYKLAANGKSETKKMVMLK